VALHLSNTRANTRARTRRSSNAQQSPYQLVTDQILEALKAGVVPWRKPWHETAPPCNAVTGRPYHGINFFLLSLSRFQDHRWLTYRQARESGGHVRTGEKATLVVFWKKWEVDSPDAATGELKKQGIPLLRHFSVFNVQQCDELALPPLEILANPHNERIAAAEQLLQGLPDPPRLHTGCKQACYYPLVDVVQIPSIESFLNADAYYATLFHELGHATGHERRLNRKGVMDTPSFGTCDYSREELVAELTSSYCCAALGLDNSLIENAASYIEYWWARLKSDPKAIVIAAGYAQRAADHIRGLADVGDAAIEAVKP
jgi:antirestriction protein ArdC